MEQIAIEAFKGKRLSGQTEHLILNRLREVNTFS
jgi:hypothetical protein